jgi:serine/threonine protein kinase/tetratricopeptide (TPR) repeat protein
LNAAAIADPAERQAYLDARCGGDDDLRREVEDLLRHYQRLGSFLDSPPALAPPPHAEAPGSRIGPYKLLEPIGEGGMGTVWMAEQQEPVRRLVALKVIKAGLDSAPVVARFEAERQALALMDHPHIAKVLDGGTTTADRPYFVMELVKGMPLTRYCDEQRLTMRQRLALLVPVCRAVQHAHQKGVIHRDLKPSNLLVALYDGRPVPKVIDFGVAKATGQKLTERTLVTGFGAMVGTLEYMAPEQAELNQLDVDTRSDIYSLGVVLYELLTGTTPLGPDRLRDTPLPELLRRIKEEEPPRPSTRLSGSPRLPTVAVARQAEPRRLCQLVRGELDWIVMKALEKDRSRRYQTASGLARDLERYLADEPVEACPPSAAYRLRKFARKHRRLLTAAGAFLGLLLLAVIGLVIGLLAVNREQQKTQAALAAERTAKAQARGALDALTDDVVETLFARQPELGETEKAFLRKVLTSYDAVTRELGETGEARLLRARGLFKVARLRALLGEQRQAEADFGQAVSLLERLAADFPKVAEYREKLATSRHNLGITLAELGKQAEAETAFRRAAALRQKLAADFQAVAEYRQALAVGYHDLGLLLWQQGRYGDAEEVYRQAVELNEKLAAESPRYRPALARSRAKLGDALRDQGRYAEAEGLFRQALSVQQKRVDESPIEPSGRKELASSYNGLGIVLLELGKGAEAETAFRRSLALRKGLAEDFPKALPRRRDLAAAYNDLGNALRRLGKYVEAEEAYHQALALKEKLVAETGGAARYRQELARSYFGLGHVLRDQKKYAEAEAAYRQALAQQTKLADDFKGVAKYQADRAGTVFQLGQLLRTQHKPAEALPWYDQALALLQPLRQQAPHDLAARSLLGRTHCDRARVLDALNRSAESLADWDRAVELMPPGDRLWAQLERARSRVRAGQVAEAVADAAALTKDAATPSARCCEAACVCSLASAAAPESGQREAYAGQALALLRRARDAGFFKKKAIIRRLKQEADLEPLRSREDFRKFVAELEAAAKP